MHGERRLTDAAGDGDRRRPYDTAARRGRAPLDPLPGRPQRVLGPDRVRPRRRRRVASRSATGETLGLVGECGSGKTTFGRAVLRRHRRRRRARSASTARDITHVTRRGAAPRCAATCSSCSRIPYASLNPRMTVLQLVAEPLVVHGLAKYADRRPRRGRRPARAVRTARRRRRPLPARVQRRPAPAHRHRPGARAAARVHRRRRAGLGARRVGARPGRQPPPGPPARARPDLPVHRPRPVGRAPHLPPHRDPLLPASWSSSPTTDDIYERTAHPYTEALLSSVPIPDPPLQRASGSASCCRARSPTPINPPSGLPVPDALPARRAAVPRSSRPRSRRRRPATGPPASSADDQRLGATSPR